MEEGNQHIQELADTAEGLLFSEGGSLTRKKLASYLNCKEPELQQVLEYLSSRQTGGLSLIQTENEVALVIGKNASEKVLEAQKRELSKDIGDAGLEVLAIILYMGPSTRARIDYIRGVNTASTLRTLMSRGLVERKGNPDDAREYLYQPTVELLAHIGVKDTKELPDYASIIDELKKFEDTAKSSEEVPEESDTDEDIEESHA